MPQKNTNRNLIGKVDTPSENKSGSMENWRNEHGHPSNEFLQSLANDGGPGAMEKLRSIASDLDAKFSPAVPLPKS